MTTFYRFTPSTLYPLFFKSKGKITMAEFLRNLYLADGLDRGEPINPLCVSDKLEESELAFLCDVGLSNPLNKRYSTEFKNGMNLKELFEDMTSNLERDQMVGISNGTKTPYNTVKIWIKNFDWNLSTWITDDKNPNQNVVVKVDGKNLKADAPVKVSKI